MSAITKKTVSINDLFAGKGGSARGAKTEFMKESEAEVLIRTAGANLDSTLDWVNNPKSRSTSIARYARYSKARTLREFINIATEDNMVNKYLQDLKHDMSNGYDRPFCILTPIAPATTAPTDKK